MGYVVRAMREWSNWRAAGLFPPKLRETSVAQLADYELLPRGIH